MAWHEEIISELDQIEAARKLEAELVLRRDRIMQHALERLWRQMLEQARKDIEHLSAQRPEFRDVRLNELNGTTFEANKLKHPAVYLKAERLPTSIKLSYTFVRDIHASPVKREKWIEVSSDSKDRLMLSCDGLGLVTMDDMLKLIFGPVFGHERSFGFRPS